MEGNRDEAEKCVQIAREALSAGNRDKAQRFLQKAEKLYPLPAARGEPRPPRPAPRRPRPLQHSGTQAGRCGVLGDGSPPQISLGPCEVTGAGSPAASRALPSPGFVCVCSLSKYLRIP